MASYYYELWIKENVPDKEYISKDAVILLLKQAYNIAIKEEKILEKERRREDEHGPRYI